MNKYVIELRPDCKVVQEICESDGQVSIGAKSINYLEELNSDYINEHFGDLQDTAYQKGFEDGKAQREHDDKIEVGDEVNWLGDYFIVTRIFQPRNGKEQCDGIDDDGCVYHDVLMDDLEKTGRRFDIQKILEDMRND